MRLSRVLLAAAAATAAFTAPASAAVPDVVSVEVNGPIQCVTEPCDQPPLLEVCVLVPTQTCVAVDYDGDGGANQ